MVDVEDLALDFTIPGYDIELRVCNLIILTLLVLISGAIRAADET